MELERTTLTVKQSLSETFSRHRLKTANEQIYGKKHFKIEMDQSKLLDKLERTPIWDIP